MVEKHSYITYEFLKKNLRIRTELSKAMIIGMTATLAEDLMII